MTESPVLQIVLQRSQADCAIAVLASYLGKTYEDVLAAAATLQLDPKIHRRGMWTHQMEKTAEALGVRLRRHRKWDLDTSEGILCLFQGNKSGDVSHVVILKGGYIFDMDGGTVWEPDVYLSVERYKPTLLVSREER